jgi:hypothetical protein
VMTFLGIILRRFVSFLIYVLLALAFKLAISFCSPLGFTPSFIITFSSFDSCWAAREARSIGR